MPYPPVPTRNSVLVTSDHAYVCSAVRLSGVQGQPCNLVKSGNLRANEFYKKGCQEKKLRLDRRREDLFLEIQPTVCKSASRFEREVLVLVCLPSLWGSSADGDDANRAWKSWQASPWCFPCPPWFYRRLEAYPGVSTSLRLLFAKNPGH